MSSPFKKLAGQTAVYGVSSIIGRFLNYLLVPFYTRIFTTEQFGIVTEMYAYVAFLIVILTYGMETTFFKFSSDRNDKDIVFSTSWISVFTTSLIFIIVATFFSVPIGNVLGYPNHTEYVIWFAIIIGLDAVSSIPMAKLRQLQKATWFMGVSLANIGINLGLNIFFLVYCRSHFMEHGVDSNALVSSVYDPEIGVGYVFISNLIASIIKLVLLSPLMVSVKVKFDKQLWKTMMPYTMPLMVLGFAGIINETIDRVLLKQLLPMSTEEALAQTGIYGANYKIAMLMMLFIQAFRFAAEPFFFAQHKNDDAKENYAKIMNYFLVFCLLIFLGIMFFKDTVILFIGGDFREGQEVIPILLVANIFFGIVFNLSIWYKLSGKTKYGAVISIIGALITLVINYVTIPTIGYMGSAWATLICYVSMAIMSYIWGQKEYPIDYNLKRMLFYMGLTALFYIISLYVKSMTGQMIGYSFNIFLLGIFVAVVYWLERPKKTVIS